MPVKPDKNRTSRSRPDTGRLAAERRDVPKGGEGLVDATKQRIDELLVAGGVVTQAQYDEAAAVQRKDGGDTIDILIGRGYLAPSRLVEFLLGHPGALTLDTSRLVIGADIIGLVSPELARKHRTVPMDKVGETVLLGALGPLDECAAHELEEATGMSVRVVLCPVADVEAALAVYYPGEETSAGAPSVSRAVEASARIEELKSTFRLTNTARLIQQLNSLPALPETVHGVHEAIQDPSSSIRSVVDLITMDPPVAAKVLSVANSAAYGLRHDIHDLRHAVALLGLRETYAIVLSIAVIDFLNKVKHLDYRSFWLESICCATAARIVAKACGQRQQPGVFSAALLHDLGRAALWEVVPDLYLSIDSELYGVDLVAEEERVVGLSHTEAGYELACRWNLPAEIAEPIRFHHQPERATTAQANVAMVALADALTRAEGGSVDENRALFEGHEAALELLSLDSETAETMIEEYIVLRASALREAGG